jgi:coproporphyrinogen III oxidase-like Fe-S oxidoreductase
MERLLGWSTSGLVEKDATHVRVTRRGRFFLRTLCAEFDAYLAQEPATRFSRAV